MTDTATLTLAAFLEQRIAEDEAVARAAVMFPDADWIEGVLEEYSEPGSEAHAGSPFVAAHIARHDPARALADCQSRRRIVELHEVQSYLSADSNPPILTPVCVCGGVPCPTLRALAAPYADHEDFRPEWHVSRKALLSQMTRESASWPEPDEFPVETR